MSDYLKSGQNLCPENDHGWSGFRMITESFYFVTAFGQASVDSNGQINFTAEDLGSGGPYLQGNEAIFLPNIAGQPTPLSACTAGVGHDQSHQRHQHHYHGSPEASGTAKIPGKKAKSSASVAKKKDFETQDLVDKRSDLFAQLDAAGGPVPAVPGCLPPMEGYTASVDLDSETESNHDTALTLACAGGHEELVKLLLERGADIG
jgi:hypothetical protein